MYTPAYIAICADFQSDVFRFLMSKSTSPATLKGLLQGQYNVRGWAEKSRTESRGAIERSDGCKCCRSKKIKQRKDRSFKQTSDHKSFLFINLLRISIWKTGSCRLHLWWQTCFFPKKMCRHDFDWVTVVQWIYEYILFYLHITSTVVLLCRGCLLWRVYFESLFIWIRWKIHQVCIYFL